MFGLVVGARLSRLGLNPSRLANKSGFRASSGRDVLFYYCGRVAVTKR